MAANTGETESEIKHKRHTVQCLILKVSDTIGNKSIKNIAVQWSRCVNAVYHSLFAGAGDVGRYSVFTVHDHGEGLTVVGLLERRLAAYQHEQDHAEAPDI